MTKEEEGHYGNTNVCWFCERDIDPNKVRDECLLTFRKRIPAHKNCNREDKQKN